MSPAGPAEGGQKKKREVWMSPIPGPRCWGKPGQRLKSETGEKRKKGRKETRGEEIDGEFSPMRSFRVFLLCLIFSPGASLYLLTQFLPTLPAHSTLSMHRLTILTILIAVSAASAINRSVRGKPPLVPHFRSRVPKVTNWPQAVALTPKPHQIQKTIKKKGVPQFKCANRPGQHSHIHLNPGGGGRAHEL